DEIAQGHSDIDDAESQIADGEEQLEDGRDQLESSQEELDSGQEQLDQAKEQAEAQGLPEEVIEQQFGQQQQQLDQGREQLEEATSELNAQEQELEDNKQELADSKEELEYGERLVELTEDYHVVSEDGSTAVATLTFDQPNRDVNEDDPQDINPALDDADIDGVSVYPTRYFTGSARHCRAGRSSRPGGRRHRFGHHAGHIHYRRSTNLQRAAGCRRGHFRGYGVLRHCRHDVGDPGARADAGISRGYRLRAIYC